MRMTTAEYLAHQAKFAAKANPILPGPPPDEGPESKLQAAIRQHCADEKFVCLCGSMATRTHRTLGELDFTIAMPKGRVIFVEAKTKTGKVTDAQSDMLHLLSWLGHEAYVARSMREYLYIINKM